jgi:phage terminase large subunit GpA-like protein
LTVSQFADAELIVPAGPLTGARWRTDFAPYQRGLMDAFHEPGVDTVVIKGSSQWGKTSVALNIVAYHIAHDPCPILVVEPTERPMAEDFSKNRLTPLIDASPALRAKISEPRAVKQTDNTIFSKRFGGGFVAIGGANSAASLAARSIRLLVLDELNRYPPELAGEGSTVSVAIKRTSAYGSRKRILKLSSPTRKGGPISAAFEEGDQRRYFVPCLECGHMHTFEWKNVRWANDDPETAHLVCPGCGVAFGDRERIEMLDHGDWRPTATAKVAGTVSFHLWEAYSPLSSLKEIVTGFLAAKRAQDAGDRAPMHTWINTTLGEEVEAQEGEGAPDLKLLLLRREEYPERIPHPGCCLTAGVDTQDDRLEARIWAWGPGEECWLVDRQTLPGDTSQPTPWRELDGVLRRAYPHELGPDLYIRSVCIDSAGHRTTMVYGYCARQEVGRIYATIGRDGDRPIVSSPSPRKWGTDERPVPLYTIGVDAAKALLISRLRLSTRTGPGVLHFPMEVDEEFFDQLTSERLHQTWTRGVPRQVWIKKHHGRNEELDCWVLALAALRLFNQPLDVMARRLEAMAVPKEPAEGETPPAAGGRRTFQRRFSRSSYLES